MYKDLIHFFCVFATCTYAQIQDGKKPDRIMGGGEMMGWSHPTTTASKQQIEHYVTVLIEAMKISSSDGRGIFTVDAMVLNNTELTLQFVAGSQDRCLLVVEPVPATKAKKPPQAISLTPPIKTVAVKPHSSIKAQGFMDIGDQQIKDFKSIRVRALQVTDASLRIKVKPNGDVDYSPE